MTGTGHNGGPPLDGVGPHRSASNTCGRCRFWHPPAAADVEARRRWELGLSRRRVREPSGYCHDQPRHDPRSAVRVSGATPAHHSCANWRQKPAPVPAPASPGQGQSWVTIYKGDRVVWQGREEHMPVWARQGEMEL